MVSKTAVRSLNEEKRTRENHEKIKLLSTKIKPEKPFDLTGAGKRVFYRESKVVEVEFTDYIHQSKKGELYLYLFNDVLLVTRKAQFFDEYKVKMQEIFTLANVIIKVDMIPPETECMLTSSSAIAKLALWQCFHFISLISRPF